MKKNIYKYLALGFISIVVCSCGSLFNPPNDDNIYISGQYVIEENGEYVPFRQKVRCGIDVTYNAQEPYPTTSTYPGYFLFYSEDDGSFEYEIKNVGSYMVKLNSSFWYGDTLVYSNGTTIVCPYGEPQRNITIPLIEYHMFFPKVTPKRPKRNDSITLTINHDALTLIELCDYSLNSETQEAEYAVFQRFEADCKKKYTFKIEEKLANERDVFILRFTTLHYGTYKMPLIRFYD